MVRPATLLLALALVLIPVPTASAVTDELEDGSMHCSLPTSVECIQDWTRFRAWIQTACRVGNAYLQDIPEECIH